MRRNLAITIESIMLVALVMPAGMLLAADTSQPPAVRSSTANWFDADQASNLINQIQARAIRVRREVARLQVQGNQLNWQVDSQRLARATADVDTIGKDFLRLDQMKSKLEPWQQSLIHKITPQIHEIVYQMDAAIHTLNAHQNHSYLWLTQYPQNINKIYANSNRVANTIQTVTQYAQAEEKMAALSKVNRTKARS